MRLRNVAVLLVVAPAAACVANSGIIPVGPNTYTVSEMRAPVMGGGAAARQAVVAEAAAFCTRQGRIVVPLELHPDGDPYTPYFPTAFDATFSCR